MWYHDLLGRVALVVAWGIPALLVLAVATITLCAPALYLTGISDRLDRVLFSRRGSGGEGGEAVCSVNADCPPGFVCKNGRCVRGA